MVLRSKGPIFNWSGDPPAQKLRSVERPKSLWRPLGAARVDFLFLFDPSGRLQKTLNLASHRNLKDGRHDRPPHAPCPQRGPKSKLLTSLLVSIFDFFYTELGNRNFVELTFSSHACCNLRGSGRSQIHHKSFIVPSKFQ